MSITGRAADRAHPPAGPADPSRAPRPTARTEFREARIWLALAAAGLGGTALIAGTGPALGIAEPPWRNGWDPRLDPLAAVPLAVAATVIALSVWWASTIRTPGPTGAADTAEPADTGLPAGTRGPQGMPGTLDAPSDGLPATVASTPGGVADTFSARFRLPWAVLLLLGWLGALAWSVALALVTPGGPAAGLRAPADLVAATAAAGDAPHRLLAGYSGTRASGPAASFAVLPTHPPGPALLTWLLGRAGLSGALPVGLVCTVLGALCVPVVCVAVRSLCHETAARRLVPVLVLAPWGGWMAGSPDAVTALLTALAVAVGVVGCEPGRRSVGWALGSGLLLGLAALFGYAPVWLGVAVAAAYFVRRRPLLNAITGLGALVPLWLFAAWGFSWPAGLALARMPDQSVGDTLAWVFLDLTIVVLATGPVGVRAARRLRLTPGWPFLLGAAATALFAVAAGLADGAAERTWLPLFPWLLVAAVAPRPRPTRPGDQVQAGDLPVTLMSLGALAAIALRLCLGGPA